MVEPHQSQSIPSHEQNGIVDMSVPHDIKLKLNISIRAL
jgi:hypothetical protein